MRYRILVAVLCFGAINLLAQPKHSTPQTESNSAGDSKATSTQEHNGIAATNTETTQTSPPKWYTALQRPDWWLVIIALFTGFAIFYQASEMTRATRVMDRQLKEMQESGERQMRAYVCLDSAVLKFPQPDVPEAQVNFRNSGQTPAYDVRGWIHTWLAAHPLNEALPPAPLDLMKGSETLAPDRITIFITPRKAPLHPQFIKVLGTPKLTFYVYGELRYKDVFGKERVTKFRLMHGGPGGVRSVRNKEGAEGWNLKPDIDGNEAD
jgi:hypothetical protein